MTFPSLPAPPSVTPSRARPIDRRLAVAVAVWLVVVAAGMGLLLEYQYAPGTEASAPPRWPTSSHLTRAPQRFQLVMVVHPRCSCTRASIGELSWLMTRLAGQVDADLLFVHPRDAQQDWSHTDLWKSAEIIEGVEVKLDLDGAEATKFGAATSGQTYLYAPSGELVFSGGITPGRSHAGNSLGRESIVALVEGRPSAASTSAVYGCAIDDAEASDFALPNWRAKASSPERSALAASTPP